MKFKSPRQPFCRFCGKPIAKASTYVDVRDKPVPPGFGGWENCVIAPNGLHSKADCQKHTNNQVLKVSYSYPRNFHSDEPAGPRYVSHFTTWDGESYVDQFFCNGDHAQRFGYAAARADMAMPAYNEAKRKAAGASFGDSPGPATGSTVAARPPGDHKMRDQ